MICPNCSQLLFALGLAAIVVPAQRLVRPRIGRLLFPQRLVLEQRVEHLLAAISSCAHMQELTRLVGERLDVLLEPAAAVVYARAQAATTCSRRWRCVAAPRRPPRRRAH